MRFVAVLAAASTVAVLAALCRAGSAVRSYAIASAYSRESSGPTNGCDGSQLHDGDLTFASELVPCGARVRFCIGRRCVVATRRDSGPFLNGRYVPSWRAFDLNVAVVRALGFSSASAWGVRRVAWSRVG